MTEPRKPRTPRGRSKAQSETPEAEPAPKQRTPSDLAALDPIAFQRQMLELILIDLQKARESGKATAVVELTRHVLRLRAEIAEQEEAAKANALAYQSSDQLAAELVELIGALPEGVFERVESAVQARRTGKPRMRVVK